MISTASTFQLILVPNQIMSICSKYFVIYLSVLYLIYTLKYCYKVHLTDVILHFIYC